MTPAPAIHPSILNADQAHLADELDRIADADGLHVDIMDNHFVPNHFGGPSLVETVLAHTALPVDAHLMIEDADRWAPAYAEAGAAIVTKKGVRYRRYRGYRCGHRGAAGGAWRRGRDLCPS